MKIQSGRFVTSMDSYRGFPGRGLPEIAMVGKSNVGKSSMINRITNTPKLARTSSEPGKTRLINIFAAAETPRTDLFYLVDLPGYGFAKAPKEEKARWAEMIEGYLKNSRDLKRILLLVDIRHDPTDEDKMMVTWMRHYGIPFTVIATKADKVSGAKRAPAMTVISRALQVQPWEIIPWSAETGFGAEAVLKTFADTLA